MGASISPAAAHPGLETQRAWAGTNQYSTRGRNTSPGPSTVHPLPCSPRPDTSSDDDTRASGSERNNGHHCDDGTQELWPQGSAGPVGSRHPVPRAAAAAKRRDMHRLSGSREDCRLPVARVGQVDAWPPQKKRSTAAGPIHTEQAGPFVWMCIQTNYE